MLRKPLLVALLLSFSATALAGAKFSVEDQFERKHSHKKVFAGKPVAIIAGAQRKTQDAMEAWHKALKGKVPKGARMIALADLDAVPFFIPHSAITKGMKKAFPRMPVLCDWDGEVYPKLGFPKGALIGVGVFKGDGKRLGMVKGKASGGNVKKVVGMLEKALAGS